MQIRELSEQDLRDATTRSQFFDVLSNLSDAPCVGANEATVYLTVMDLQNKFVYVAIEDNKIVATASLIIEHKFIHGCASIGHIEDVVTHKNYEDKGYGTALINQLIKVAEEYGCYKVILDCKESNIGFYERFGFKKHEVCMRLDI